MRDVHVAPAVRTLQRTVAHLLACVTAVALHVLDTDFRSILQENVSKTLPVLNLKSAHIPTTATVQLVFVVIPALMCSIQFVQGVTTSPFSCQLKYGLLAAISWH